MSREVRGFERSDLLLVAIVAGIAAVASKVFKHFDVGFFLLMMVPASIALIINRFRKRK